MAKNERSTGRIRSGGAKARLSSPFFPGGPQETGDIIDVSVKGMGFQFPFPLATDQEVSVELYHPILTENVQLKARVVWCRMVPGDSQPNAGIEFTETTDRQRLILRMIQASELSCRVISDDRTVGFVVTPADDHWALYDHQTMKVAAMARDPNGVFQVTFYGTRPEDSVHSFDADTLPEAVATAFNLEGTPLIIPPEGGNWIPVPIQDVPVRPKRPKREQRDLTGVHKVVKLDEPDQEAAKERTQIGASPVANRTSQAFHSVLASGYHVGFVAVTSVDDVWSLYDEGWNEVALMSPHEGRWKVVFVGGSSAPRGSSESLDYLIAKTFLGGLSLAFDLKVVPELDPPLAAALEPTSTGHGDSGGHDDDFQASGPKSEPPAPPEVEDEEAPLPANRAHHCILNDANDLVGYVAPTLGVEGYWSVYNTMRERVAMVAPDGTRFKIMFIGSNPDDSLDYMVAKSLKGAFALTFDMEAMPKLDPPLDRPGRT